MAGNIYVLQDGGTLIEAREAAYDSEALLQRLLADYPNLLAGDQMNADDPRRWLLVTREMAVPGVEDGPGRWALDHLFLDQEAIPTLIEVKRSTDTRIRREVVGQLLDYAANAVAYWPVETVQARFETRCGEEGLDSTAELAKFLGEDGEPAAFWQQVKTNLQAGRIRLVFVADVIPPELRRVIEFLNQQMDPGEVLGVEIRQYVGAGLKTLVPRVVGTLQKPKPGSSTSERQPITEGEFWRHVNDARPAEEQAVVRAIVEWSRVHGLQDAFKTGSNGTVFMPTLDHAGQQFTPFAVNSRGFVALQMRWLANKAPFTDVAPREELRRRLEATLQADIGAAGVTGFPKVPLSSLVGNETRTAFLETLDWLVAQLRVA